MLLSCGTNLGFNHLLQGVEPPSYPPLALEAFISTIFLSGSGESEAFEAKLALLTFVLVDANFLTAPEAAESLQREFGMHPSTTMASLMLLFLDDARLISPGSPNSSLDQAINCLPGVDGRKVPFRSLQVFLDLGRPDVALGLLRQRHAEGTKPGIQSLEEACTALRVRLGNGIFVEAFIELRQYLTRVPENLRGPYAQRLMDELLNWSVASEALHAVIGLPVPPGAEEDSLVYWLENNVNTIPQAGLALVLFFLMRGRTPEALQAHARHGHASADNPELKEMHAQVESLLKAAANLLPTGTVVSGHPELRRSSLSTSAGRRDQNDEIDRMETPMPLASPGLLSGLLPPRPAEPPIEGEGVPATKPTIMPQVLFGATPQSKSARQGGALVGSVAFSMEGIGMGGGKARHELDKLLDLRPARQSQSRQR